MLSADPPITEIEVAFLREALKRVSPIIFVLTKKDRLEAEELTQAMEFLKNVIKDETSLTEISLFAVDSKAALKAGTNSHDRKLSGITQLEQYLRDFSLKDSKDALRQSVERKTHQLLDGLASRISLELHSLRMPLEKLKAKLALFEKYLEEMELERQALEDIVRADHERALARLEEVSENLRKEAVRVLTERITTQLADVPVVRLESEARALLKATVPDYFDLLTERCVSEIRNHLSEILDSREKKLSSLIKDVLDTASEIMGVRLTSVESEEVFKAIDRPYWASSKWTSTVYPSPDRLLERFMPETLRRARVMKRIEGHIEAVVIKNVEQLRWAVYQAINKTFWSFEHHMDEQIGKAMQATHGAITKALSLKEKQSVQIRERTELLSNELERIRKLQTAVQ